MIHHIENDRILPEVFNTEKLVIIDFFAEWCGPCQMLSPILLKLSEEYKEKIEVYKVNVDESQECAIRYDITAMPTIIFFKNGQELERQVGYLPEEELTSIISELC